MQPPSTPLAGRASGEAVGVLFSGGLDSAILLAEMLCYHEKVQPLYIRCGHFWERTEREHADRFLAAVRTPDLQPLCELEIPVKDLYPNHWSITGVGVPTSDSPDGAVFLPGRNVLLLGKAMTWCHLHSVNHLALGTLGSNPFPDATADFFRAYEAAVNRALGGNVRIHLPFASATKIEVMRRGREMPLELTFSCIQPAAGRPCGRCNKCAERRRAFHDAGMSDPTIYTH
jgi:7-cyano-7-deazaguanine synthase